MRYHRVQNRGVFDGVSMAKTKTKRYLGNVAETIILTSLATKMPCKTFHKIFNCFLVWVSMSVTITKYVAFQCTVFEVFSVF